MNQAIIEVIAWITYIAYMSNFIKIEFKRATSFASEKL